MTEPDRRTTQQEARLPPLSASSSRQSDSNHRPQHFSPPMHPSSSAHLPPPPPTRLHSYHHPISASYAPSNAFSDRNRQPPPSLWKEHRSPPMEQRPSEGNGPSFSRLLPPLSNSGSSSSSNSNSMSNPFQLPSLSANLPSSASWHGREGHIAGNGAQSSSFRASREALSIDVRRPGHDSKLPSLSGQLGDYQATRHALAEASSAGLVSPSVEEPSQAGRKPAKAHVPSACLNCKRAHLACDVGRPCRRCVNLGKSDTCIDVQHKKRGRPRLKDRPSSQTGIPTLQTLDGKSDVSESPASASYARHSPGSEAGYFRSPTRGMDLLSPPLLASTSVMQVAGRTHGAHAHPRSASNSVSASSYPYSRPDHIRHPMDANGGHGGGYSTSSWSYQQNGLQGQDASGKSGPAYPMAARQHSHSQSYEHPYHPYQQHQQQQQQSIGQQLSQTPPSPHPAASAPDTADGMVSAVVSMICSTNLQCARISEECVALLGYQPGELNERSLFELVHPSETSRLQDIWTSLIDPVGVVPQAVPAAADVVMSTPAARLMTPAAGTIFVQENMRLRQRNSMYDFYSVRLHIGGGFGVDLYRRETLDRAYIVASLLKLGNDAVHPDPSVLRSPYAHDPAQARGFRTPSGPAPAPGTPSVSGRPRWEAEETAQRSRSKSVNQRPSHFESNGRRPDDASQTKTQADRLNGHQQADEAMREDRSRGVKRSSAEMDEDASPSSSRPAPSMALPANSSYAASKNGAPSPPPALRSIITERGRGTSRDGILC